jgi:hypothetical protein
MASRNWCKPGLEASKSPSFLSSPRAVAKSAKAALIRPSGVPSLTLSCSASELDIIELGVELEESVVPPRRFSTGSATALGVSILYSGVAMAAMRG